MVSLTERLTSGFGKRQWGLGALGGAEWRDGGWGQP